ncbi:hypothetical protein AB0N14_23230 [Streptomyces sp. NPDC051104]|uniref:hypothetical protein n=1 Tax=Streptomyces sp. NPDC051104 TaxID=3155044 RepID=UPI00342A8FBC
MKRHAAAVMVAGWGLLNGVLLAVLAVYGEASLVYWLWGSAVALLELAALLVLGSSEAGPEQHTRYRLPRGGAAAVLPAAAGITLGVLSAVYGLWLLVVAVPLLGVAAALAVRGASTPGEG